MAQSFQSVGGTLYVPNAYASYTVQNPPSGLATTGVIAIVGEAAQGPSFNQEQDLALNIFGPSSFAQVAAKYGSGNIVDAFQAVAVPSKDPAITGSPQAIIIVKTNQGSQATGLLPLIGGGTYATLWAESQGTNGNLTYWQVLQASAEVPPAVPTSNATFPNAFTYIPAIGTLSIAIVVNGVESSGAPLVVTANTSPSGLVSALNGYAPGIVASGGVSQGILVAGDVSTNSLKLTVVSGYSVTIQKVVTAGGAPSAFAVAPQVGQTLLIPTGSVIAGGAGQNVGAYVVTGLDVTGSIISAVKLSDSGSGSPAPNPGTAPVAVVATPIVSFGGADLSCWSAIRIVSAVTSPVILNGVGKTLELADANTGGTPVKQSWFTLGTTTGAPWVSTMLLPYVLDSSSEYSVTLNLNNSLSSVSESWTAGGQLGLTVGYAGALSGSALVSVSTTALVVVTTGGPSPGTLTLAFSQYPTIASVAQYLNAQSGFSAAVGNVLLGQSPSSALDRVTNAGANSQWGVQTLNLKIDAYALQQRLLGSILVIENSATEPSVRAASGLPAATVGVSYLGQNGGAQGSVGGTSDAEILAALQALQAVSLNFIVPLFSQDATADVVAGLTDPSSTYQINSINAETLSHCLLMSQVRYQKNRQCLLSYLSSFDNGLEASANLASPLATLCIENATQVNSAGNLQSFQPWMSAVLAAGMQSAGFYQAIVNKQINTSGVFMADGSFNPRNVDQLSQALQGGLLVANPAPGGGFVWTSDQTTYGKDNNFVYNSLQAVYAANIVALTTAQQMWAQFGGSSVADTTAALAESAIEAIMANLLRLKLIAPSEGAPKGFKNVVVNINAPVMSVSLQVYLATALYFIPISFQIAPVSQTATSG